MTPELRAAVAALPELIESGETRAVFVRGARHNGRRTLLGALARSMGRGVIELRGAEKIDDVHWREAAALAMLRHALPIVAFDLGPGETLRLPESWPACVPLGVVLGRQGGLSGELASAAVTLSLDLPDLSNRAAPTGNDASRLQAPELIAEISARATEFLRVRFIAPLGSREMRATLAGDSATSRHSCPQCPPHSEPRSA